MAPALKRLLLIGAKVRDGDYTSKWHGTEQIAGTDKPSFGGPFNVRSKKQRVLGPLDYVSGRPDDLTP
jgi:hypothetical protein